jgi:hypothetical protein
MSTTEDVQSGMWDELLHDLRVDWPDNRIVIARQNQRWLS